MRFYPAENRRLKVVYCKATGVTGPELARKLAIGYTKTPRPNHTVAVRWGSSRRAQNDISLNSPRAIMTSAHGVYSLLALKEQGVPCPEVFTSNPEFPVMARSLYHHHGGIDLTYCESQDDVPGETKYFTKYMKADKEFRVHVFGATLKMFRKVPRETDADMLVKTTGNGWGYFRVNHSRYYQKGQEVAQEAVTALGLKYGGVDLGWNEKTGQYFVFEVNTGPGLNSLTIDLYADKFIRYLSEEVDYYVRPE